MLVLQVKNAECRKLEYESNTNSVIGKLWKCLPKHAPPAQHWY